MQVRKLKNAYVFDVDGVLSNNTGRVHLLHQDDKTRDECWQEFLDASAQDDIYEDTAALLKVLYLFGYEVLLVTGRAKQYHYLLDEWLEKYNIKQYISEIYERADGDHRKDYIIKKEIYNKYLLNTYKIFGIYEDNDDCVEMWRSLGLTCYQPRKMIDYGKEKQ